MNLKTEEIKVIAELPYSWEKIKDKTILVSGGTGFIGTAFVDVIKYRNQKYNENIKVISFSRRGGESSEYLECIKANVKQPLHYEGKIDYIIHLASNTHPKQYARSYWNNYDKHIWMRQFVEVSSREKGTFSFSV